MSQELLKDHRLFMADCQYLWKSIKAKLLEPHQIYCSIGQSGVTAVIIVGIGSGGE